MNRVMSPADCQIKITRSNACIWPFIFFLKYGNVWKENSERLDWEGWRFEFQLKRTANSDDKIADPDALTELYHFSFQ